MIIDKIPAGKPIGPHTRLENGSPVRIGNSTGIVLRSEQVDAHPCGTIIVHEIRLTKKITKLSTRKYRIDAIDRPIIKPNYASIFSL